ncbi:hypothetical protein HWN40_04000 [Methanolobus zinderi]|uniref:Uncharacterized protein n=1 Tax=Methanolobus zinderi TaxID=536044 RepID=A0A7D5EFY4_9EURY|nr:hypothetical protein [Methanolobus zinderi]QLC49480.1 hypothetical protein HWN40_04000 [Methanolobus zinderi]
MDSTKETTRILEDVKMCLKRKHEWKKMGFSKGNLYYMKKNAEADEPFSSNSHIKERFEMLEGCKLEI